MTGTCPGESRQSLTRRDSFSQDHSFEWKLIGISLTNLLFSSRSSRYVYFPPVTTPTRLGSASCITPGCHLPARHNRFRGQRLTI